MEPRAGDVPKPSKSSIGRLAASAAVEGSRDAAGGAAALGPALESPWSRAEAPPSAAQIRGWPARMRRAAGFAAGDVDTVVVALAGFLLRGGVVLLALPAAVVPSILGLASVFGVNAFGIDGRPTLWFIEVVVAVSIAAGIWLLIACVVGSLFDVWLIHAQLELDAKATRRARPLPSLGLLLDMASIRAVCLVPVGAALVWAVTQLYDAAYNELTMPADLATPLLVRIVIRGAPVLTIAAAVWLVTETVAAIGVRHMLIGGTGFLASMRRTFGQVLLRPVSTLATTVVAMVFSVVAMAIAIGGMATAFGWCLDAARAQAPIAITLGIGPLSMTRDFRPAVFLGATLVMGLAWLIGLALAGVASALRSATLTEETAAVLASAGELPAPSPEPLSPRQSADL